MFVLRYKSVTTYVSLLLTGPLRLVYNFHNNNNNTNNNNTTSHALYLCFLCRPHHSFSRSSLLSFPPHISACRSGLSGGSNGNLHISLAAVLHPAHLYCLSQSMPPRLELCCLAAWLPCAQSATDGPAISWVASMHLRLNSCISHVHDAAWHHWEQDSHTVCILEVHEALQL